jgi:AmiR/NasT family two-component response regulator
MPNPLIQIDDEIRPMNAKELAQYKADVADYKSKLAEEEAKATDKAALLNRLGITAEEAALLLG